MSMSECPTPYKRCYGSRKDAKRYKHGSGPLRSIAHDALLRPYRCGCGWWHLGHLGRQVIRGARSRAQVYGKTTR